MKETEAGESALKRQTEECLHLCTDATHMHNNSWIMVHAVYHWRHWNHSYWRAWL